MESEVDLDRRIALIKKQACFSKFTQQEMEQLAELLTVVTFKAADTIVNEGDMVDCVYLIDHGRAEVKQTIVKRNSTDLQTVAVLEPDQSIGLNETGFYSLTGKRSATVVAITDMVLLRLDIPKFHGFELSNHHVKEVMRENSSRST